MKNNWPKKAKELLLGNIIQDAPTKVCSFFIEPNICELEQNKCQGCKKIPMKDLHKQLQIDLSEFKNVTAEVVADAYWAAVKDGLESLKKLGIKI